MRVVSIEKFGNPEVFRDDVWPMPEPQTGHVRVQIKACSLNPIDVYWRLGKLSHRLPAVGGRDFAGVVDAVGAGVDDLTVGDEVYGYHGGRGSNGSNAEFICVPSQMVALKPRTLAMLEAAAVPVVGMTAHACVFHKAQVKAGQSVLVTGASGSVGQMLVQLVRLSQPRKLVALAGNSQRVAQLVDGLGFQPAEVVSYQGKSVEALCDEVTRLNDSRRYDITFDLVGGEMKRLCFASAAIDGHVVSIVEEPADFQVDLFSEERGVMAAGSLSFHFFQLSALALSGSDQTLSIYRNVLSWLAQKIDERVLVPLAIECVGPLSAGTIRDAHERLGQGKSNAKLVVSV